MSQDRKTSFKVPPSSVRDALSSQETRRKRALEDQKRRRAERIDSTRQLDIFADLSLGQSDDEADAADDGPEVVREGIGQFATMLSPLARSPVSAPAPVELVEAIAPDSTMQTQEKEKRHFSKNKRKGGARRQGAGAAAAAKSKDGSNRAKPSKWADKCMYAELLEMNEDFDEFGRVHDGIPDDIEIGWIAVAPVPVGKRCLAVTHQASGVAGVVPNTTLRSRVLGKALMKPFPSALPPQTVLDCILDDSWRDNGILHVLDVLSWKGQDLADCETPFRFWWRDTRLSELNSFPPPSNAAPSDGPGAGKYQFPHPTTFSPIPYHDDTSLAHLRSTLIPLTRTTRSIPVSIPVLAAPSDEATGMELDTAAVPLVRVRTAYAEVSSDGMLLYVAQASYEPGTSPLSSWVPLRAYQPREEQQDGGAAAGGVGAAESPLDVFERLVSRKLAVGEAHGREVVGVPEVEMTL